MTSKKIKLENNYSINVEIVGQGAPLLCISGLACSHFNFLPLKNYLKQNFTLYMIDNRGFGKSSATNKEYSLYDLALDSLEVMKKLEVNKFSVVGISMGGFVAQLLAIHHKEKIDKLFLLSTKSGGDEFPISRSVTEESFKAFMKMPEDEQDKIAIQSFVHPNYIEEKSDELIELIKLRKDKNPVNLEESLRQIRASWKFIEEDHKLEDITAPTLIIHGMEDNFLPLGNAIILNERIKKSNLVAIHKTAHLFFFEKPSITADHMLKFQKEEFHRNDHVGILGLASYLPKKTITAKEISEQTKGTWSEESIIEKLGIKNKYLPGENDGTQEMGAKAAKMAIEKTSIDPLTIDLILCVGEEWKEYPLTTSGIYIQEYIGATNALAIDVQQRCCTTIAAMKIAKDMMLSDSDLNIVLICGGYRNGDFVDYTDKDMSMMYNLSAGGGAIILKKNLGKNVLLGTHLMSDGSLARDVGVRFGGTVNPVNEDNLKKAYKSLQLFNPKHMKDRLNDISMKNWMNCIDKAFIKSKVVKEELNYLCVLHFKRSMHNMMLDLLKLNESQSTYLEEYGHIGQIDQILSLELGLKNNKINDGTIISMIAAGIGYAWAANVIKWGPL